MPRAFETADSSLLTLSEVAKTIRRQFGRRPHRSTIYRWCESGRLPCVRIGSRIHVWENDLESFLDPKEVSKAIRQGDDWLRGVAAAERIKQRHPRRTPR